MTKYTVYIVERGHAARSVALEYDAGSPEAAADMWRKGEPPDDIWIDDEDFWETETELVTVEASVAR